MSIHKFVLISVPGIPPENLAVLFTNTTSIQLTWSPIPPVFVNALSLLGYEVFWGRINDSLVNFTRTEQTQAWLTELEVFTEYAVVINAFNNIGSGPNSSVMIVRTTEEGNIKNWACNCVCCPNLLAVVAMVLRKF